MQSSSSSSESGTMKVSPFDLMSAIIRGGKVDPSNVSSSGSGVEVASIVLDNKEFVMILTTSIAVLIGCVVVFILRRSSSSKPKKVEPLKPLVVKEPEVEVDDGKQKVTIFFGTQTGTAEGFAKALADEARARYDKAIFKVVDIDDYADEEDEYEEKLKKENIVFFFLAT
ncbi:hypothetical protein CUMW_026910 [Citrus unshiu]|nr:hypothetical protein CUMW_026910 [Citrus unshiu]